MEVSTHVVRLISAVLASLTSAAFVSVYNTIEIHHARLQNVMNSLPNITNFFAGASPYGFIIPFLVLVVGILFINVRKAAIINITISYFGWVFSLAWSLGCILAWKLPYYIPVIELK